MTYQNVYLAAEGGAIYCWDRAELAGLVRTDTSAMGLAWDEDTLVFSTLDTIARLRPGSQPEILSVERYRDLHPHFHQMQIVGDFIYHTATDRNEIFVIDKDSLELVRRVQIDPPDPDAPAICEANYNHLNNIFFYGSDAFIDLNWGSQTKFSHSGVAQMTSDLRTEKQRFEYGWETHGFCFLDDTKIALCGSSHGIKDVHHPKKGGLLVGGELRWEYDATKWFCKGLSADEDHLYVAGGEVSERNDRSARDGVLFILTRDFELHATHTFSKSGGFTGILLEGQDLTRNNRQLSLCSDRT